jgi:alanine dehydrogenase
MIVGTVRETKVEEYRVGLTPEGAHVLAQAGHRVIVETGAGEGSGLDDEAYRQAGATIAPSAADIWQDADLIIKVKEPQPEEFDLLRPGLTLFGYLHLAASPETTRALLDRRVTAIAFETVQLPDGTFPLLVPMSQIAGRMAVQIGAQWLRKPGPGRGKLLSGLPGLAPAHVVILGAGTVSTSACAEAVALGARVTMIDPHLERLRQIEATWRGRVTALVSTPLAIAESVRGADLLIGGVLVPGGLTPKLVTREMVRSMGSGAVVVDVCIDQGGCVETSRPTTHAEPIYVEEGVLHYCVANIPGAVPRTATSALAAATLPYLSRLADHGPEAALRSDPTLTKGLNTHDGHLTYRPVAEAQDLPYTPAEDLLS